MLFSPAPVPAKEAALVAFLGDMDVAAGVCLPHVASPVALAVQIQPALACLRDASAEPITLAALAELAGMSRYQRIRAFRAVTGMTPHAWQLNWRIQLARERVRGPHRIADVAQQLGFADQAHFQRAFKAHAGVTPGVASGACAGIALANGGFIVAAFVGAAALRRDSLAFTLVQATGCLYLIYMGVLFLRHAGGSDLSTLTARWAGSAWWRAGGMGFLSALLNPKVALFYTGLAAMPPAAYASASWKMLYGVWMFGAVLSWDLLVAGLIGNPRVRLRFARTLPWLERLCGALLLVLAAGVIGLRWVD